MYASPEPPAPWGRTKQDEESTAGYYARVAIIVLYSMVTVFELVRGTIHTFFYEAGLHEISGLATGDALCDNRLGVLMVGYGGANLESFLIRAFVLYLYVRHDGCEDLVRVTSIASILWYPITAVVAAIGELDPGGAELPGWYAMLARSVVSLVIFSLTYVR